MSAVISDIILYENEPRPVSIQFQNGEIQEGEEKNVKTAILKSGKQYLAAVATTDILYTGSINREDDLYNNFLVLHNRKTGKIRLVAIDNAILSPQLNLEESEKLASQTTKKASSASELHKEFGSKRIKRITEQRERLTMNIDHVKEQLEQTVANIDVDESDTFTHKVDENDSAYRPPINRDATSKERIYELSTLVPKKVLDCLEDQATNTLQADLTELKLSEFVTSHLQALQGSAAKDNTLACEILLYVDYLIKFIVTPAKHITKRFVICDSSKDVNAYILDNFSVISNTGRSRPMSMRDKTICYILVLAAIANDYHVDMDKLSKSIKIGIKKLCEMARILAFSKHSKDKNLMLLKLPLPPLVPLTKRAKRK